MTEAQRQWAFTIAAVLVLLFSTALGNALLQVGAALVLLAVGAVMLPRQRSRGIMTAVIAACAAAAVVGLSRLLA